jgi:hypothetical protein
MPHLTQHEIHSLGTFWHRCIGIRLVQHVIQEKAIIAAVIAQHRTQKGRACNRSNHTENQHSFWMHRTRNAQSRRSFQKSQFEPFDMSVSQTLKRYLCASTVHYARKQMKVLVNNKSEPSSSLKSKIKIGKLRCGNQHPGLESKSHMGTCYKIGLLLFWSVS